MIDYRTVSFVMTYLDPSDLCLIYVWQCRITGEYIYERDEP